jgi:hypothetical protein
VETKEENILFSKLPSSPAPSGLSSVLIKEVCQATRHQTVYNNMAWGHEDASVTLGLHRTQVEHVHIHTELQTYVSRAKYTTNGEIQTGTNKIPMNARNVIQTY